MFLLPSPSQSIANKAITIGRYGTKMAMTGSGYADPIWVTKEYVAAQRKKDGKLTYRLMAHMPKYGTRSGRKPSSKFISEIKSIASLRGINFYEEIRHGDMA